MAYKIRKSLNLEERNALAKHSNLMSHLLFHRGLDNDSKADEFINPNYDKGIHDPFLLKDAEKSARRIIQAIKDNEKIAIFADYDADGIPGAAIWDDLFRRIGFKNYIIYIPHRHNEGFGLNNSAIESLVDSGVKLMITVDCGITDVEAVEVANKNGMEVIITDHHEPPLELPKAFAIVDHKQDDCDYPDKNLCGSGVAFKLISAILKIERFGLKEGMEKWMLDLVGIATMSDMVPLVGENRIFAHYGLSVLRKSPRKGIMELLRRLKINQKHLTEDDIGFMITPRINAASRMGVPMDAFKLLTASTDDEAYVAAKHLDTINNERKGVVASLVKEVKHILRERHGQSVPSVIVLGNPEWKPSLLGLAANSCAEEFNRPVFLWGRDGDNEIKGSCRSEGITHVVELMRNVPDGIFTEFGGHKHSGGFGVVHDQIHFLYEHLNKAAEKIVSAKNLEMTEEQIEIEKTKIDQSDEYIDAELGLDDVDYGLMNQITKLAPFGIGNLKPVFIFKRVMPKQFKVFGKTNEHVEIVFHKSNGEKLKAISFFSANEDWAKKVKVGELVDLIASLEKSMFMNRPELRLRVVDVCI